MTQELDALLARVDDPALRADLARHIERVKAKRQFGLVFENHLPETVRLPSHPVRRGSLVTLRSGDTDARWVVERVSRGKATLTAEGEDAHEVQVADLVVLAEFGTPIYPGLKSVGSVRRGGDKPSHVVINGENHHALEALQFTHAGKVDCIYIDPPYNTGARDWKYNNDYVEADDQYRHSKWLAFMERRLRLARELLNSQASVLIITIDEKEYLRLGLLIEQLFPDGFTQMASIVTNPSGSVRPGRLARTDEFAFFVFIGNGALTPQYVEGVGKSAAGPLPKVWETAIRSGAGTGVRASRPNLFYPVFIDAETLAVHSVGDPLDVQTDRSQVAIPGGTVAIWPLGQEDREQTWAFSHTNMRTRLSEGTARVANGKRGPSVLYLQAGVLRKIESGVFQVVGRRPDGALELAWGDNVAGRPEYPRTTWNNPSHSASSGGTRLLSSLLPGRSFPYPKSLYAVEDTLRYVVGDNPRAVVLDFFAGSGTTAHAVMRLNRQDEGQRRSISITNNEVSPDDQRRLRATERHPGDPDWEELGIFHHITKPRILAAVAGRTPDGAPIAADYRFTDEFPMSDGFEESVEFFELTYQDAQRVELDLAFEAIAPLLWMRAGSVGPIVTARTTDQGEPLPYTFGANYGVLFDTDEWRGFVDGLPADATTAFVVTDSTTVFAAVSAELPPGVESVRLYSNYLSTFEINRGEV